MASHWKTSWSRTSPGRKVGSTGSANYGCRPNARQMRCTLVGKIPTRRASFRFDQCVAPSGASSRVRITTSSAWASVMVRGTPGRGSSLSPSSRLARNRPPGADRAAIDAQPRGHGQVAAASRAGQHDPRPQGQDLRRTAALAQLSNVCRSSSDNTSGANLGSGISPAHRTTAALSPRYERSETKHDSSGDGRTQDRDTRSCLSPRGIVGRATAGGIVTAAGRRAGQ